MHDAEGNNLTEALFTTHKLCRTSEPSAETLCFTLIRTANALGKVIRLVAHRHGQLSRHGVQTSGQASLAQDKSNFALAMTICARGFMSVLVGLARLTEATDDTRLASLVVCELADMFKTVLIAIESVARQTAQQVPAQVIETKRAQDTTPAKVLKESVPARALAHLLIGLRRPSRARPNPQDARLPSCTTLPHPCLRSLRHFVKNQGASMAQAS